MTTLRIAIRVTIGGILLVALLLALSGDLSAGKKPPPQKPIKAPAAKTTPAPRLIKLPPYRSATIVSFPAGARVVRQGKSLPGVKQGTRLQVGDMLLSGPRGYLDVRVGGQGTLRLKPNTKVGITTLLRQSKRDPNTIDNRFRLDVGTALVKLRSLKGQSRFILDTPAATTAARGTAFIVRANAQRATLLVDSGVVSVLKPLMQVSLKTEARQELDVGPQQKATVERAQPLPAAPQPVTGQERQQLAEVRQLPLPSITMPDFVGWIRSFEGHTSNVTKIAFTPDGSRTLSASYDGTVRLWDVESGGKSAATRAMKAEFAVWPSRPMAVVHSPAVTTRRCGCGM